MMSLSHSIALWNNGALRLLDRSAHVWFQFRTLHFPVAVNGINLPIVVKEHTQVVDATLHIVVLPRSANVLTGIALQPFSIDVGVDIELPIGITDTGSPDALTIYLLMIFQRESVVVEVKTIEAITDILPVHQILGVENNQARHRVHRGAHQIIVVADTKNVRVGKLVIEQWVGVEYSYTNGYSTLAD